ncbi:MAG: hypothetical protein U5N10_07440 [Gemmobacter sp.]|nr:hypothetical protein [Gemmobacter sp.]
MLRRALSKSVRVLFGHRGAAAPASRAARPPTIEIHIADHRNGFGPQRQRPVGAAIRRHQHRRMSQRQRQITGRTGPARDQRDRIRGFDNRLIHADTGPELRQGLPRRAIINPSNYPHLSTDSNMHSGKLAYRVQQKASIR